MMNFHGCSTCQKSKEKFESFYSPMLRKRMVQYDYRTSDGRLFSTIQSTLADCRAKRDQWLKQEGK